MRCIQKNLQWQKSLAHIELAHLLSSRIENQLDRRDKQMHCSLRMCPVDTQSNYSGLHSMKSLLGTAQV